MLTTSCNQQSGLLLNLAAVLSFLSLQAEATQLDCTAALPPIECCELEPGNDCFLRSIPGTPRDTCSVACQRRFQTLGWRCYSQYHMGFRWQQMQNSCDPQMVASFTTAAPPVTRPPIRAVANSAKGSDSCRYLRALLAMSLLNALVNILLR